MIVKPWQASPNTPQEGLVHIASFLLLVKATGVKGVVERYNNHPLIEVCETEERGKLIVIAEVKHTREIRALMDEFDILQGVISTTLVYHHAENEVALREEVQ